MLRPAHRRIARALPAGFVAAALVVAVLPALPSLPMLARGPIKVSGQEIATTLDHQQVVALPEEASHVSLRWSGGHDALITIAFGDSADAMSDEIRVGSAHDEVDPTPDAALLPDQDAHETVFSDVLWTGGAAFARITTDRPLGQVSVMVIDAQADRGFVDAPIAVVKGAMSQPAILSRADWGADEDLRFDSGGNEVWPPNFSPMQKAIVHHTAGRNNDPNPAATVRAINYLYTVLKDYGDMGYNFLIDEDGRIYEGRYSREYADGETPTGEDLAGNVVRGAHARNFNDGTVGIVLLGTFMNRQPTNAARNALERLLAWKLERHGIDPRGASTYVNPVLGNTKFLNNISGHRNVNQTACPGDAFYPKFPGLRKDVDERIDATTGSGSDTTEPRVVALARMATNPTGANSIPFGLVFREPIEGLSADDFDVDGSSTGWSVSDIDGEASTWKVWLTNDNPDAGSVVLTLLEDSVTDLAGLSGPPDPVTRETTFEEDDDAPTVVLYQTPHKTYVNNKKLGHVDMTATFSEPVTGFSSNDVDLGGSSHSADHWNAGFIFGEGATYGFSIFNGNWRNGTLTIEIDGGLTDMAGNAVTPSGTLTMIFDSADPSVATPKVKLQSGAAGGDIPVTISWTGDDAGPAGIATYDVQRSINGKKFKTIASGITADSINRTLDPGDTYRFRVRATDKAGNVGDWKTSAKIRPRQL